MERESGRSGRGARTEAGPGTERVIRVAIPQLPARSVDEAAAAHQESLEAIHEAAGLGAHLAVLPECTWPGYVIGAGWRDLWESLPPQSGILERYAAAAREHSLVLVAGVALRDGDVLTNAAVVWDTDGSEVGRVTKRFLWDFDRTCFAAGVESPVIDTSIGRLGIMICADGRMPEIARLLAVGGAEILLDPTAWVTTQPDPQQWSNPQFEFMLPTRARENGLWAVAANKVGIERDAVAYCGRSCVVDHTGTTVAAAPPHAPAVLVQDCRLGPSALPVERRPALYASLTRPTAELPANAMTREALVPAEHAARVAVDALGRPLDAADGALLADLGVALLVTPREPPDEVTVPLIARRADTAELAVDGRVVARWERTHGPSAPGTALGPVVDSPLGAVAVLIGPDGVLPEAARVLMLEGAETIVWFPDAGEDWSALGRARAAENRVNVVVAAPRGAATPTAVYDPDGRPIAAVGEAERLVHAVVALSEARRKEMAPGTDVVTGRQPAGYALLTTGEREVQRAGVAAS